MVKSEDIKVGARFWTAEPGVMRLSDELVPAWLGEVYERFGLLVLAPATKAKPLERPFCYVTPKAIHYTEAEAQREYIADLKQRFHELSEELLSSQRRLADIEHANTVAETPDPMATETAPEM